MGPEFPMQRATYSAGRMNADPPFSEGGDGLAPAPGLDGRIDRQPCPLGAATCVSDRAWAEGQRILGLS